MVTFNVPPLQITGTAAIIVLMLFIRRLPYAVRSSAAILKQIKGGIEEAAISLGAPPWRAFLKVTLPLMLPGVIAGALMSFITAINELSSSLILYVGRTMTMPVRIYLSVLDGQFRHGIGAVDHSAGRNRTRGFRRRSGSRTGRKSAFV